ncbi:MAG: HTH domain-containing protein [Candidatus Zixiibacteriota bacterium]
MTKSERLLYVMSLLRNREKITIDDLSRICGISKRTVYRDIRSLKQAHITIDCDQGYFLTEQDIFPELKLDRDEQELLGFCLNYTLLNRSAHFTRKLAEIENKLIICLNGTKRKKLGRFLVGSLSNKNQIISDQDQILKNFFNAMLAGHGLCIKLKPGGRTFRGLKPVGLSIETEQWLLCLTDNIGCRTVKIPLNLVETLDMAE